jgi:uncharacterized RmlC-like cupin family protein
MAVTSDLAGRGPAVPSDGFHRRLYQVAQRSLSDDTGQTPGMRRVEALSGTSVGSSALWMGQTHVAPATKSANHHHGKSETGIYVAAGHPEFVFLDGDEETRLVTGAGDYVYVPPWVPHREENPDPDNEAVVILARTTQQAIVVNLPDLRWVGPVAVASVDPESAAPLIACQLSAGARRERGEQWSTLLADAVTRDCGEDGAVRIGFPAEPDVAARIAELALREQQCCPFFHFSVDVSEGALTLSVSAPPEAGALVEELFGTP